MFTGIIQATAPIIAIKKKDNLCSHLIQLPEHLLFGLTNGASIAYNGCCLTVTSINNSFVSFDLMQETLHSTNLAILQTADKVNVERAASFNTEIGGHIMSGHIMGTAEIIKIIKDENNTEIWFRLANNIGTQYILHKGYIGVDGISLTVGKVLGNIFCVYLIPETIKRTTLGKKKLGSRVNIEIDTQIQAIVDTVERLLSQNIDTLLTEPGT